MSIVNSIADLHSRLPLRLSRWAPQFLAAELCYGVDPLLMAAIVDRESLGGDALKPPGPKGYGDHDHGRGLAQIDDRYHRNFVLAVFDDGPPLWTDPTFNILYAGRLLARNIVALNGDVAAAVCAYNAGVGAAKKALAKVGLNATISQRLSALNAVTTGGDYVESVYARRGSFVPRPPVEPKSPP